MDVADTVFGLIKGTVEIIKQLKDGAAAPAEARDLYPTTLALQRDILEFWEYCKEDLSVAGVRRLLMFQPILQKFTDAMRKLKEVMETKQVLSAIRGLGDQIKSVRRELTSVRHDLLFCKLRERSSDADRTWVREKLPRDLPAQMFWARYWAKSAESVTCRTFGEFLYRFMTQNSYWCPPQHVVEKLMVEFVDAFNAAMGEENLGAPEAQMVSISAFSRMLKLFGPLPIFMAKSCALLKFPFDEKDPFLPWVKLKLTREEAEDFVSRTGGTILRLSTDNSALAISLISNGSPWSAKILTFTPMVRVLHERAIDDDDDPDGGYRQESYAEDTRLYTTMTELINSLPEAKEDKKVCVEDCMERWTSEGSDNHYRIRTAAELKEPLGSVLLAASAAPVAAAALGAAAGAVVGVAAAAAAGAAAGVAAAAAAAGAVGAAGAAVAVAVAVAAADESTRLEADAKKIDALLEGMDVVGPHFELKEPTAVEGLPPAHEHWVPLRIINNKTELKEMGSKLVLLDIKEPSLSKLMEIQNEKFSKMEQKEKEYFFLNPAISYGEWRFTGFAYNARRRAQKSSLLKEGSEVLGYYQKGRFVSLRGEASPLMRLYAFDESSGPVWVSMSSTK